MSVFEYKAKVEYPDLDINKKMGIRGFLKIMQEVAGMHSSIAGYGINDIERTGVTWVIINWKLKINDFPKCNEILNVKTWPRTFGKISSYRDFEVYNEEDKLIAIATSKWILVDANTHGIKKISEELINAYNGTTTRNIFDERLEEKLTEPNDGELLFEYKIQRRDLDTNRHVNNLNYVDFAINTLPEEVYNKNTFSNIEIMYKKELKLNDEIQCFYSREGEKHIIVIKDKNNDNCLHAIVKLY